MHMRCADVNAERGQRSGERAVIKAMSQGGCSGMCDMKLTCFAWHADWEY